MDKTSKYHFKPVAKASRAILDAGKGIPEWQWECVMRPEAEGFVYVIVNHSTEEYYIGKKLFWKAGKRSGKKVRTVSDWKKYWGSSKKLQADIKEWGYDCFSRYILQVENEKCQLNLAELLYQINHFADPKCMNSMLNVRLYKFPQMLSVRMQHNIASDIFP